MFSREPYALRRVVEKSGLVLYSAKLPGRTKREAIALARSRAALLDPGQETQIVQIVRGGDVVASFRRVRQFSRKHGEYVAIARRA